MMRDNYPLLGRPGRSRSVRRRGWSRFQFRSLVYLVVGVGSFCMVSYYILLKLMASSPSGNQLLLAPGQNAPSPEFCARERPPLVCAHGGDTTNAPPNTLQSFQAAINAQVDCVEIDVARTRDDELVVLHVRDLKQILGDAAEDGMQVGDITWEDVSQLQWERGEYVMKVKDAIMMTKPYVDTITLDIKTYFDEEGRALDEIQMAEAVVKLVSETDCTNCLVWAKSDIIVKEVKRLAPYQRVGFVVMNETAEARRLEMDKPNRIKHAEVVAAHYVMVDTRLRSELHYNNKQLFTWTVNDAAAMIRVLDAAVDGVVTNFPRMLQATISTRLDECARVA